MKKFTYKNTLALGLCSLLSIAALAACGDDSIKLDSSPAVSVTADKSSGIGPLDVQFFSSVVNGNGVLAYEWNFGDGTSSDLANPSHIFDAGSEAYTVVLTVTDEDNDEGIAAVQVAVGTDAEPTVMATANPVQGTVPLTVDFDCTAAGGDGDLRVLWSFGEGSTDAFASTSFTYTQNGVYNASCTVEDEDGDLARDTVTIAVGSDIIPGIPQAIGNATPITGTVPLEVEFFGSSIGGDGDVALAWDFGDGESDTVGTVSHTYTAAGIYNALLTATDEDGDSDTVLVTITAVDPAVGVNVPPVAVASVVNGECAMTDRTVVQLDGSGSSDANGDAVFLNWEFVTVPSGSNSSFNNNTVTNPVFTPDLDGDYVIRLVANDGQAFDSAPPLTVTADGPSVIVVNSGDNQEGQVDTDAPVNVAVNVANACGATAPGINVRWSGFNTSPSFSASTTTANGDTATGLRFGTASGAGTLTATVADGGANVVLDYVMTPGPAQALVMDEASSVVVSDTASTITYRVTDQFGNPVTTPDVTFDLALDPQGTVSNAQFDACDGGGSKTLTGVSTTNGVATVDVCNTTAEDVFIEASQISVFGMLSGGRVRLFSDDMEGDDADWINNAEDGNEWERGEPTFPAGLTVPSGTAVRGTLLDGQLFDIGVGSSTSMSRTFDLSYPIGFVAAMELSFEHYVDIQSACAQASLVAGGDFGAVLRPTGGYPAGCSQEGFEGPFADFQPVKFDLSPFSGENELELFWSIRYGDFSGPLEGAGWYIDDVTVTALVQIPRIEFVPGPPDEVITTLELAGKVDGCAPAVIRGVAVDTFGNTVDRDGDGLTFTSDNNDVTFTAASVGGAFTGAGTTTSTVTTVGGEVRLFLDTSLTTGPVNTSVTGIVTGNAAGANAVAAITHDDPSEELCGDDFDNDCDGFVDCADVGDCDASAACHGDSCLDPFDLGTDELSTTFSTCFHEDPPPPPGSGDTEPVNRGICRNVAGEDMISSFTATQDGANYEVCINANDIPGTSDIFLADACDIGQELDFGVCYVSADNGEQCRSFFGLNAGTYFLTWTGEDPGQCGDLIVDINIQENCFDNIDNDLDGLTDCEAQECIDEGSCTVNTGGDESCDFTDDGSAFEDDTPAPNGTTDEFACRCNGDAGCDDMVPWPGTAGPLLCDPQIGGGVCVPNCNENDYCGSFGGTCDVDTGLCVTGGGVDVEPPPSL